MIFASQMIYRYVHTCSALLPQEDAKSIVVCVQTKALSLEGTRMLAGAGRPSFWPQLPLHRERVPCSSGLQPGLIATEPSVIQECNYLLTQIIYLAGSPYPSHRAASTCQWTLLFPVSLFIFSLSLFLHHTADVWQGMLLSKAAFIFKAIWVFMEDVNVAES